MIGAQGKEVLAKMAPMMELHIHDFYSRKTISWGGIKWAASKHTHYSYIENPVINLIRAPNGFFGYCHGIWELVAPEIITKDNENLIHIEATKEIHLLSAYRIEITHNHHERFKVGLVATANPSEISIGFGGTYTKTDEAILTKTPIQGIYRGNMHLIAPLVHTQAVNALGKTFLVKAKKWLDEPAYAEYDYHFKLTEIEVAVKIGIRSPLGNFINNVENTAKGLSAETPEGFINAGFAGYAAYLTGVQMLAGGLIAPGAWVSMSVSQSTTDAKEIRVVPSIFNFAEFKAEATEISLFASQINAYNAYIKAEELLLSSASDQSTIKQQQGSLDIEIPITGSGAPSLSLNAGKFKQYSEKHLHFVLNANDFEMHIAGKATMKGVTISANHLSASFGELIIESVKDIVKSEGFGLGIGLSSDKVDKLKSLGGSYNKGLREIVSEISSIIAKEELEIIVANALVLNGAMIANAERNADGTLTDHGNLKIVAGQLFVKHIHQIIDEKAFGASVDFARKIATEKGKLGERNNIYKASFGMKQGDSYALGTIANGILLVIGETHGETLNRDVNKANTAIELDIDIDQINMYFQGRDGEAETIAANRLKNEGIGGIIINDIEKAGKQFSEMFSTPKEESRDEAQDEDVIDLDKDNKTGEKENSSTKESDDSRQQSKTKKSKSIHEDITNIQKINNIFEQINNLPDDEKNIILQEILKQIDQEKLQIIPEGIAYDSSIKDSLKNPQDYKLIVLNEKEFQAHIKDQEYIKDKNLVGEITITSAMSLMNSFLEIGERIGEKTPGVKYLFGSNKAALAFADIIKGFAEKRDSNSNGDPSKNFYSSAVQTGLGIVISSAAGTIAVEIGAGYVITTIIALGVDNLYDLYAKPSVGKTIDCMTNNGANCNKQPFSKTIAELSMPVF